MTGVATVPHDRGAVGTTLEEERAPAERTGRGLAEAAQAVRLDAPDVLRGIIERTLQVVWEEEMTAHRPWGPRTGGDERGEGRPGCRTGAKPRTRTTRVGPRERRVPGAGWTHRDAPFSTERDARDPRSEQAGGRP